MSGVVGWLTAGARHHPSRSAVQTSDGVVRTYAELAARSNRLAQALLASGLVPGDRVALWLDNCLEYVDSYLACAKAGLVLVPLNIRLTGSEAQHVLVDSGARALVFCDAVAATVEQLGFEGAVAVGVGPGYERLLAAGMDRLPPVPGPDDLLLLGYTSGTTGAPKGAELTHRTLGRIGLTNALSCRYRLGSVQVFAMSLSFTATVPAHVLPHLLVGGTTVLHPSWDTGEVLDSVRRCGGTFMIAPTPVLAELTEALRVRPELGEPLVTVLHSASKAPAALLGPLVDVLGDRVVEGWGMTENSGGLLTASAPGQLARDLDTAGVPVPGTEIRVLDPGPDGTGMLAVRSPALFRGYWGDPGASRHAFVDGWFVTGDLGRVSDEGSVTVVDRRQDLINSGGMNVYPSEVERVLSDCPQVAACAVVGAPHPRWGQVPVAFVVAAPGASNTEAAVSRACRDHLAGYKRPVRVELVAELPRTTSGKVLRAQLTARAAS